MGSYLDKICGSYFDAVVPVVPSMAMISRI